MSAYLAFATSAFQTQLAYRNEVWANMFGKLVQVFARVAIWIAVYAGAGAVAVGGVRLEEMVTYALLGGAVIGAVRYEHVVNAIGKALRTGDVAVWLLKPASFPLYILSTAAGDAAYRFIVLVVPTTIFVALFYGMLPPASPGHGIFFVAYWLLAYAIVLLTSAFFGLLAFWLLTSFSLEWLLQALLSVLSGSMIPFWFFPQPLGEVLRHLPFAWIVYYPAAVWLGRMSLADCALYFALGLFWAALTGLGVFWLWRRAARRTIVQGG